MARKRQRLTQAPYTVNGPTYIYIDNVPKQAGVSLTQNNASTSYFNARELNLPVNAPDPHFFRVFESVVAEAGAAGIVVTADRGKGDRDMLNAVIQTNANGLICTVMVSVRGGENINIANEKLHLVKEFKDINSYPQKYSRIILSKNGNDLEIRAFKRNSDKIINRRLKDAFTK